MAVFPYAGLQFFFYNIFKKLLAPQPEAGNSGGEWKLLIVQRLHLQRVQFKILSLFMFKET